MRKLLCYQISSISGAIFYKNYISLIETSVICCDVFESCLFKSIYKFYFEYCHLLLLNGINSSKKTSIHNPYTETWVPKKTIGTYLFCFQKRVVFTTIAVDSSFVNLNIYLANERPFTSVKYSSIAYITLPAHWNI